MARFVDDPPVSLAEFSALPPADAQALVIVACPSESWARAVAAARPFASLDQVAAHSDRVLSDLAWPEILAALATHPRIGERAAGATVEARWSGQEQARAAEAGARWAETMRDANERYERCFGHRYLVCAAGRSGPELLADLEARLLNAPPDEERVVRGELAAIARQRLGRILG